MQRQAENSSKSLQILLDQFARYECTLADFKRCAMELIAQNADITTKDTTYKSHGTLLHHLILSNENGVNKDEITQIITLNKYIIHLPDGDHRTPLQALMDQLIKNNCSVLDFVNSAMLLARLGANLTVKDTMYKSHATLLHHLILNNKIAACQTAIIDLLTLNPNIVDLEDSRQCTPLQTLMDQFLRRQCSINEFKSSAIWLTRFGAKLTVKDTIYKSNLTLLHHLVLNNVENTCYKEICELLTQKPDTIKVIDGNERTALQALMDKFARNECTAHDFVNSAMLLTRFGADLTVKDTTYKSNLTLLHHLVLNNENGLNNRCIASLLAKKLVSVDVTSRDGHTPLQTLMNQFARENCRRQDFKNTAMLLAKHGANLRVFDSHYGSRATLMHHLVLDGASDSEISDLQKMHENIINIKDADGRSPLQYLLRKVPTVSTEIVDQLLRMGSNILHRDSDGETLLHTACHAGNLKVAQYLVNKGLIGDGLAITCKTNIERTLLHSATNNKNSDLWQWLLESEVNLDAKDTLGYTALHLAVLANNIEMVKWLILHNANLDLTNQEGCSALQIAVNHGLRETADLLLQAGAKPHQRITTNTQRFFQGNNNNPDQSEADERASKRCSVM